MNKVDIVKAAMMGPEDSDTSAFYSDDFQATNSVGDPVMDKVAWLGMTPLMRGSFPDIEYVVADIREEGGKVSLTGHFVGTFTNDLDLSAMGMGVIPASGKRITWPVSHSLISVEGGKITQWHGTDTGPNAGRSGFFMVLGAG